MNDNNLNTGPDVEGGREAWAVLVVIFVGGLVLIAVADRVHHVGPTLGNVAFVALPLIAASAAAARLRDH